MEKKNKVFIAQSLDGYIAGKNHELYWLDMIPNPDQDDMGFGSFTTGIDAIIMGRVSFEVISGFDVDWPYDKPVFVWSQSLQAATGRFQNQVEMINGDIHEILRLMHHKGYGRLYIDGGQTVHSFLKEDLIDEMTITTMPILLGGGIPLFRELDRSLTFDHVDSKLYLDQVVQHRYVRQK